MFWKNAVWSWVDAAGNDDDDDNDNDGGYLLAADLRRTPDSTPEPDLNQSRTPTEPKEPTNHSLTDTNYSSYGSTLFTNNNQRHGNQDNKLTVTIVRGTDGFGFTICCDCPVRVQAVDPDGPAHRSGLHEGDSILQLNGLPVETWKCVDLAHAIRSCPSQIVLVVWRGLPELRSCDTLLRPPTHSMMTGRKLLSHPSHSKHSRRWGQGAGVRSSLGALGSLWGDRKEDHEEYEDQEEPEFSRHTTTLKGTRVTSNGDNYIILSPVSPGGQLLQPVYQDRNGALGRLYQTHPSRGQNLLHDPPPWSSRRPFFSTLTPPTSSSAPPSNHSNYQNCTIIQSHLPCSGTYVTLAPKTLIFPVFVQPLDLCSPERTLLMSEEMVLHQVDLLPAKVTVLIYSDLLLLTREDESGHCNVLQSPVYLNTLQLGDVVSEPLRIYLLQNSQNCCRVLFSLEAFSMEQKVRVSLCLHDNMQLVTTETGHGHQFPDLQSDFGLLSLYPPPCDSTPLPPFSPSSPIWKEREGWKEEEEGRKRRQEEEEERQQGEGESASETSEHVGGVWGCGVLLGPAHFHMKEEKTDDDDDEEEEEEEEELHCRTAVLRRSFSEGSLLQEPWTPRFLSDSTIHRLTRPVIFDLDLGSAPQRPSPRTPRKQLTREGGSLHHMMLLLNGPKAADSRNHQMRKKTRILATDVRSRLAFLRRRKNGTGYHGNSLEKALRNTRPSGGEVLSWADSLEALLTNQYGQAVFRHFLRLEFSEENLDFWLAVEKFKKTRPLSKMAARAAKIYEEFISTNATRQVNMDSSVIESTNQSLRLGVSSASFQLAQDQIFGLMETDSYPRFLNSPLYAQLANHNTH
ncbi:regulator of G-protein signaling 3-like isoform X2 [Amphiprion ocellaris]|uniref:regulator of G-protein signaling 3-like isoform X2 n=1 Tax=Amphiprion ocellaris TaxID=80972 RepID=UPI002410F15C|nr:regulator of G-protein signaling 3-like isoform X2 [Amphiprion ocellaris]